MMKGQWITCPGCDAPWVMGNFHAQGPVSGTIEISGLGFFELYLNGRRVSDELLTPAWSDYSTRDGSLFRYPLADRMHHRVYRCVWNVHEYLRDGSNDFCVLLGNGWYSQHDRVAEGRMAYGEAPILWFELRWQDADGEHLLPSGPALQWRPSQIVHNNVYTGETQDLRLNDRSLRPVEIVDGPDGEMDIQQSPSDKLQAVRQPVLLGILDGLRIYDAGETMTGWAALTVTGPAGAETVVQYAEMLHADGTLDFLSCGKNQVQTDRYISSGEPVRVHPHFTWHAFRYFSVQGMADDIVLHQVHADVPVTGSLQTSSEQLNWLVDAYLRTRLNNMHCGVPSDCPHRERLGYTGDGQATAMTDMYLLDADAFYRKWMQDIMDGQDPETGHGQHTAPFYGGGGGPGGWGGAIVLVPWAHYQRYGDANLLRRQFPAMRKWVDYMVSRMDARGVVVREESKGWCLGDWCAPEAVMLPEAFVNTCYLARCLCIMLRMADDLHLDAADLSTLLDRVQSSIRQEWWDGAHYAGGIQGADALALEAGLGGASLADTLAAHYREQPWFDTGFLATGSVIRMLCAYGHVDTALALLLSDEPDHSFGWQRQQGADTLWERWNGTESRDHPMFGGVLSALFEGMMGISLTDPLTLTPVFPNVLTHASCTVQTRCGTVRLAWERVPEGIRICADLPAAGRLQAGGQDHSLSSGRTTLLL